MKVPNIYFKSLFFLFLAFFQSKMAFSQTFDYAKQSGGSGSDRGYRIAVDGNGSIFQVGIFEGTATFGSVSLTASGGSDIVVIRYDASGNVVWAKKAGGTAADLGLGIAVSDEGVFISGLFAGTATFGSTSLISAGGDDAFVAKLDANGNFLWAKRKNLTYS